MGVMRVAERSWSHRWWGPERESPANESANGSHRPLSKRPEEGNRRVIDVDSLKTWKGSQ